MIETIAIILSLISIFVTGFLTYWSVYKERSNQITDQIFCDYLFKELPPKFNRMEDSKKDINSQNEFEELLAKIRIGIEFYRYYKPRKFKKIKGIFMKVEDSFYEFRNHATEYYIDILRGFLVKLINRIYSNW